jgi:hypothetical protein
MTWNEDQKYRREWDNGSVYPSLLHSTRQTGRDVKVSSPIQSPSHNERTPLARSGPVGYRRRGPVDFPRRYHVELHLMAHQPDCTPDEPGLRAVFGQCVISGVMDRLLTMLNPKGRRNCD